MSLSKPKQCLLSRLYLSQTFWSNGRPTIALQRNLVIYPPAQGACCVPFPMPAFRATAACSVASLILQRSWCAQLLDRAGPQWKAMAIWTSFWGGILSSNCTKQQVFSHYISQGWHVGKAFSRSCCLLMICVQKTCVTYLIGPSVATTKIH